MEGPDNPWQQAPRPDQDSNVIQVDFTAPRSQIEKIGDERVDLMALKPMELAQLYAILKGRYEKARREFGVVQKFVDSQESDWDPTDDPEPAS